MKEWRAGKVRIAVAEVLQGAQDLVLSYSLSRSLSLTSVNKSRLPVSASQDRPQLAAEELPCSWPSATLQRTWVGLCAQRVRVCFQGALPSARLGPRGLVGFEHWGYKKLQGFPGEPDIAAI